MTTSTTLPAHRPFFELSDFKFRLWPILVVGALMQTMLWVPREMARWVFKHNLALFHHQVWAFIGLAEIFQISVGLLGVVVLKNLMPKADTHFRWPPSRSYAGQAIVLGVGMAGVMFLADYWPQLLHHTAPKTGYEMTAVGVPGWLIAEFGAGPNEEIIFRGVLVGLLAALVPGRVRAGRFEISVAGVMVSLLFGLAHYNNFVTRPLVEALLQQVYAFAWGLTYVWLMERSRSLLAPALAHGVGDAMETGAAMLLVVAWG